MEKENISSTGNAFNFARECTVLVLYKKHPCSFFFSVVLCTMCYIYPAVLGPVPPAELGVTLPHEHLLLDFTVACMPPTYGSHSLTDADLILTNLGKIRQYP